MDEFEEQLDAIFNGMDSDQEGENDASLIDPTRVRDPKDRRRFLDGKRATEIVNIQDNHREMIRLIAQGYSNIEVAEAMGCSTASVSTVRNSPMSRMVIESMHAVRDEDAGKITSRIKAASAKAVGYLIDVAAGIEPVDPKTRVDVCKDMLDRNGNGKVTKHQNLNVNAHLQTSDFEEINKRAAETAKSTGALIVKATPIEEAEAT